MHYEICGALSIVSKVNHNAIQFGPGVSAPDEEFDEISLKLRSRLTAVTVPFIKSKGATRRVDLGLTGIGI